MIELNVKRLLAEGCVIVVSILVAFAVDAWWESRQEQEAAQWLMERLHSDFLEIRADLDTAMADHRIALEAAERPDIFALATTYGALGDARAFDVIHTAIDRHNTFIINNLRAGPAFSKLRGEPRWAEVMAHLEAEEAKGSAAQNHQS